MRQRWKTNIGALLSLAILSVLLAACGGNDTNAGKSSNAAATPSATTETKESSNAEPAEKTAEDYSGTITLWGWDTNYYEKTFAEFQKVYPNVKLEVTNVSTADYIQKIQTTLAAGGELPDLLAAESAYRGKLYEMDIWENLSGAPYNFDASSVFDYLTALTSNSKGEIVGIEQTLSPAALAYRRDLAKQYFGTDDPKELKAMFPTWDEFVAKGKEVKDQHGVHMFSSLGDVNTILSAQSKTPIYDGTAVDVTGRIKPILDKVVQFRDAGIVGKLEQWSPQWNASYATGEAIFYPAANWSPQYLIKTNDADGEGRWGLMLPPEGPFSWGGTTFGITKNSKNKELAWLYIKWLLLSEEGANVSKSLDFYVPLKSVYEDPGFASSPDSFFAGQDIGAFWIQEVVPAIDTPQISQYDSIVNDSTSLVMNVLNANAKETADNALGKLIEDLKGKLPEVEIK